MGKIIACIDGSAYADHVCALSAWAHERSGFPISLLHVVAPHSEVVKADMSGQIGLGANANLLEELTKLDEEHGKLEQKKGQLMLAHAKEELAAKGVASPEILHRRGSLVETLAELEPQAELIIMGKRGEHHHAAPDHLGSNLERVARTVHKPLLVATPNAKPVQKFLIAYDGSPSAKKAVEFVAHHPLLKGLECHLLKAGDETAENRAILAEAEAKLTGAGFRVVTHLIKGKSVASLAADLTASHAIDLVVMGAYGHSKIRSLILGSTTTALIRKSDVPLLLVR